MITIMIFIVIFIIIITDIISKFQKRLRIRYFTLIKTHTRARNDCIRQFETDTYHNQVDINSPRNNYTT